MAYSIELFHQIARDTTLGFDDMLNLISSRLQNYSNQSSYPPYNILKVDDNLYQIHIALAGLSEDDITVEVVDQKLFVKHKPSTESKPQETIHRGIASRSFEKMWTLSEDMEVQGATFINGMLEIDVARIVPEHKKPKTIKVVSARRM